MKTVMTKCVPVSVVIPTYNAEDLIGEAIKSVHAQTLPVAEIIVVDDGSSDRSSEVAESLGAVVIRQANGGVSAARNVGIRAATSEWIAFLDQDDIWAPEKIEYQWDAIRLHPDVGIVSCDMSWFEPNYLQGCSTVTEADLRGDLGRQEEMDASIRYLPRAQDELPLCRTTDNPSSILIRRDLLLSAGLFDESLRQNEDLECFLRVITRGPLAIVERSLIQHRVHSRSRSNDALEAGLYFIRVVDKLSSEPDKYPLGAAETYGKYLWPMLIPLGRSLLNAGRSREARDLFTRSLKKRYSHRASLFWGLTFLSPAIFKQLLALKRKLGSIKKPLQSREVVSAHGAGRSVAQLSK